MREVGLVIGDNTPKALAMNIVEEADRMITMGRGADANAVCPASFIETEDWVVEDSHGKSVEKVRKIRDEIEKRVARLITQIT